MPVDRVWAPDGLGCCPFWGGGSVVVGFLFVVTPIVGVCDCSMFCCTLLFHIWCCSCLGGGGGGGGLVALLDLTFWCLVMVERLFLAVPRGCLRFVIVVFPDHTHLLFLILSACLRVHRFDCSIVVPKLPKTGFLTSRSECV